MLSPAFWLRVENAHLYNCSQSQSTKSIEQRFANHCQHPLMQHPLMSQRFRMDVRNACCAIYAQGFHKSWVDSEGTKPLCPFAEEVARIAAVQENRDRKQRLESYKFIHSRRWGIEESSSIPFKNIALWEPRFELTHPPRQGEKRPTDRQQTDRQQADRQQADRQ